MAAFSSLAPADQARVGQFVDAIYRPTITQTANLLSRINLMLSAVLASPSGAASTVASPAADSILGLLGSLDPGTVLPTTTSLAGAAALVKDQVAGYLGNFGTIESTYNTDSNRQAYALTAGASNLAG